MELKPTPTSPRAKKTNELEQLYADKSLSVIHQPGPKSSRLFTVLLAVVIGLFSGFFGGYLFFSIYPTTTVNDTTIRPVRNANADTDQLLSLSEKFQPALVSIFVRKDEPAVTDPRTNLYHPWEQLSTGLMVTSDGWLVAPKFVFPDLTKTYVVLTAEGEVYPANKIMADPAAPVYYLKIEKDNFPVPDFVDPDSVSAGQEVFLLSTNGQADLNLVSSSLTQIQHLPLRSAADYLESSDVFSRRLLLGDQLAGSQQGVIVVNPEGRVVGLAASATWPTNECLPAYLIKSGLSSLLKNSEVIRPALGLHYLDLSQRKNFSVAFTGGRENGALIFGDRETDQPAVQSGGPAEKAGLKKGDLIAKIGNTPLDSRNLLTDLIQSFSPGDSVTITVIRESEEIEVKVTLASQK